LIDWRVFDTGMLFGIIVCIVLLLLVVLLIIIVCLYR